MMEAKPGSNFRALCAALILSAAGGLVFNALPLFLSTIADHLQLNNEQMGLLGSAYLGGAAFSSLTALIWLPRCHWAWISVIGYFLVLSCIASFSSINVDYLYVAMTLYGVGAGVIFTLSLTILSYSKDPDRAYGLKYCAELMLAAALMFSMSNFILKHYGFTGFVVGTASLYGLTSLLIAWLPDNFLTQASRKKHSEALASPQIDKAQSDKGKILKNLGFSVTKITAWSAVIGLFIQVGTFSALWGFMIRIGSDKGVGADALGNILGGSIVFGILGAGLGALLGNRFGQVKLLLPAFALFIGGVLTLHYSEGMLSFIGAVCLINALIQFCVVYQMGLVVASDNDGHFTLMMAFILAAGSAVGPGVMGTIVDAGGFGSAYLTMCMVTLVTVTLTLIAGYKRPAAELASATEAC